jgi:hypothetical protein
MPKSYNWKKVWAVQTNADDEVTEGDLIEVGSTSGSSSQKVVSCTTMLNQKGEPYKVLLTQEVK